MARTDYNLLIQRLHKPECYFLPRSQWLRVMYLWVKKQYGLSILLRKTISRNHRRNVEYLSNESIRKRDWLTKQNIRFRSLRFSRHHVTLTRRWEPTFPFDIRFETLSLTVSFEFLTHLVRALDIRHFHAAHRVYLKTMYLFIFPRRKRLVNGGGEPWKLWDSFSAHNV